MALPVVNALRDCADFSKTVAPYIGQLYELPQQILLSYSNPGELRNLYLSTNPLITAFALSLALAPVFLVVSEINRNYSQVDRCWSLLPTMYIIHFATYAHMLGLPTSRLDNLLAASVIWSLRLTYNYWRKGGYNIGSEDYRWIVVKNYLKPGLFFIFNVLFIALAQSVLLFTISMPAYVLLLTSRLDPVVSTSDYVFPRAILACVLLEWFADQQQWNFQNAKHSYLKTAKVPHGYDQVDLDRGFVVTGLWQYSRHPNFAAEQTVWVALYQWCAIASDTFYNWTCVGAIGYLILFQASTWFTELISAGKYPEYKEYQKRVGKFVPGLTEGLPGDFSDQKATPKKDNVAIKKS